MKKRVVRVALTEDELQGACANMVNQMSPAAAAARLAVEKFELACCAEMRARPVDGERLSGVLSMRREAEPAVICAYCGQSDTEALGFVRPVGSVTDKAMHTSCLETFWREWQR